MKKIVLLFAIAAFCVTAAGAAEPEKRPSVAGFVSNGFWDNWEISVGAGAGTAFNKGTTYGAFKDRIDFEANFSVTKWVHPVFGARLQLQGGRFSNFTADLQQSRTPYLFAHADFMINFSNWAGGYRDDRAYYLVPFIGFGYLTTNFTDAAHRHGHVTGEAFGLSYGLLNKFRVSPAVDINLELKGLLTPTRLSAVKMNGEYLRGVSVTAGVTYRFNRRGWERGVAGYTADDIRSFQQAVAEGNEALACSKSENDRLAKELTAAQCDAEKARAAQAEADRRAREAEAAAEAAKRQADNANSLVLYEIGTATLSSKELTRLQLLAEKIKEGPASRVYSIDGYADRQTGSEATNQRLSEQRAKAVYNYLIKQGVKPEQLSYKGHGGKDNPFSVQKANRAVVVK